MTAPAPVPSIHLTPRESQVLQCVALGKSNKTIARELGISEQTVKNHVSELLFKLGVESRTQLALKVGKKRDGKDSGLRWYWYALAVLALLISIYVLLGLFLLAVEIKCG
jgi:DNA-binding CsgD family transcriptional regulator